MNDSEMDDEAVGGAPPLGAVVERTGLAVVHRGERISPAPGSRASLSDPNQDGRPIELVFPVEIEVRGAGPTMDLERIVDVVLKRLARGLAGL